MIEALDKDIDIEVKDLLAKKVFIEAQTEKKT